MVKLLKNKDCSSLQQRLFTIAGFFVTEWRSEAPAPDVFAAVWEPAVRGSSTFITGRQRQAAG